MQSTYFTSRDTDYDRSENTRFQCRHIFPDGHRCGSPCLRSEELCYYHHSTRRPIADAPARKARRGSFSLNTADLIDRSGIQLAIAEVLQRIALNDIDPRRAGLLLYGLQTASLNLPKAPAKPEAVTLVDEVTHHPTLGLLAPPSRIADLEPRSSVQKLLDGFKNEEPETQQLAPPPQVQAQDAFRQQAADRLEAASPSRILPSIHATAAPKSEPNLNPLRTLHTNGRVGGCRHIHQKSHSAKLTTDGILPLRQAQRPGKTGTRNT